MTKFLSKAALFSVWIMLALIIVSRVFADEIRTQAAADNGIADEYFGDDIQLYADSTNHVAKDAANQDNTSQEINNTDSQNETTNQDNAVNLTETVIQDNTANPAGTANSNFADNASTYSASTYWEELIKNDTGLSEKYKNNCIVIRKPDGLPEVSGYMIADDPMERTLTISVPNLEQSVKLQPQDICRIRKDIYFEIYNFEQTCDAGAQGDGIILTIKISNNSPYVYNSYEDEDNIYIQCQNVYEVYDKIVVIDAGHGGTDPGTVIAGPGHYEKDINLSVVLKVKEIMDKQDDIKIYYTRTTDKKLSLNSRVNLANRLNADFFISIHCNSAENKYISGFEVLFNELQDENEGMTSREFAKICLEEGLQILPRLNRGLIPRSEDVLIIQNANMPVALCEIAYLSNTRDLQMVEVPENQQLIAEGICSAIYRAYDELNKE